MAKLAAEAAYVKRTNGAAALCFSKWKASRSKNIQSLACCSTVRAAHSMDDIDKSKVYKQLGLFSLRKKIEDAVLRAEIIAPSALEFEEASRIQQEELIRDYNLWDDPAKSNEILVKLAESIKVVDALKDLRYKAEEAKLITQLAGLEAINYQLFKQAYNASLDVSKFLDRYELSKLFKGPYDIEGACIIIKAESGGIYSEMWAEQILSMYLKWAEKQGYRGRVDKCPQSVGIFHATVEFESEYAYGYLLGERGVHRMIQSSYNKSVLPEASIVAVDVIPLFLEIAPDVQVNDEDLMISSPSTIGDKQRLTKPSVSIQHKPTGINVQSSGERSQFANKIKALNRLKAKLHMVMTEQGVTDVISIKRDGVGDEWKKETRRYVSYPNKLVQDVKTGIQIPNLDSVLDGNIEPFIGAHISIRQLGVDLVSSV